MVEYQKNQRVVVAVGDHTGLHGTIINTLRSVKGRIIYAFQPDEHPHERLYYYHERLMPLDSNAPDVEHLEEI